MIQREITAERFNSLVNEPSIRPWVANGDGVIDLSSQVADARNFFLMGEFGGVAFLHVQAGVYEAHTQVLPAGRGAWTRELTEACVRWMFTRTDAYEIVTRVPAGHIAAKAAAEAQGMRLEFTRPGGVLFRNRVVDAHIYSFRVQDWVPRCADLIKIGRWFHDRLGQEAKRLGIDEPTHDDDENHNRYAGAAIEMAFGGQHGKAISFYNRWATLARHTRQGQLQHVSLASVDPLIVNFDIGLLKFHQGDIEVILKC